MSIFKVPMSVLNHLESIRRNFFNGVDGSNKKMVWISWKKVLTFKQKGGLGLSCLFAINRALMFKWLWRFKTQSPSLWSRVIKAIYGVHGALDNFFQISRSSPWLDILHEVSSLKSKGIDLCALIRKKVGNGEDTLFWDEHWKGEKDLIS